MEPAQSEPLDVELSDTQAYVQIDRAALVKLARRVLASEGKSAGSVSIALVDDATIHQLNRTHLGHDWPTDVLSFPLSGDEPDGGFSGAIMISAQTALNTAQALGVDAQGELALYLVHGLLHLCGYDDREEADRLRMRTREQELLAAEGTGRAVGPITGAAARREGTAWRG